MTLYQSGHPSADGARLSPVQMRTPGPLDLAGEGRAMARKGISKLVRFEVFKRDGFECQYCGAHPPGTLLEVDHILAASTGGGNEITNLVTACFECNRGKAARSLDVVPQSLRDKAAEVQEREEQLRGYSKIMEVRATRIAEDVARVVEVYERLNDGYTLTDSSLMSVKRFLDQLPVHDVMEAMEVAMTSTYIRPNKQFRYFCGICWRKIKGD